MRPRCSRLLGVLCAFVCRTFLLPLSSLPDYSNVYHVVLLLSPLLGDKCSLPYCVLMPLSCPGPVTVSCVCHAVRCSAFGLSHLFLAHSHVISAIDVFLVLTRRRIPRLIANKRVERNMWGNPTRKASCWPSETVALAAISLKHRVFRGRRARCINFFTEFLCLTPDNDHAAAETHQCPGM